MSLCLTCSKKKPLKDKTTSVASWLRNAGRDNALPNYNLPSTKKGAFSLVGGGDSVSAVKKNNQENNISFISTGGGALLEYIANGTLPSLDLIKK